MHIRHTVFDSDVLYDNFESTSLFYKKVFLVVKETVFLLITVIASAHDMYNKYEITPIRSIINVVCICDY